MMRFLGRGKSSYRQMKQKEKRVPTQREGEAASGFGKFQREQSKRVTEPCG